jgi:glycosyltransferase involved in cell wall biosynthesis
MQGGVGDYTREMARAFVAQGHTVSVLVSASLAGAYHNARKAAWRVLPVISSWGWTCWGEVLSVLRDVRPDVVNVQYQAAAYDMRSPAVNLLPWRLGRERDAPPIVVTFHDLKPPYLFPKAGPLRDGMVRVLAAQSDAVIVTNAEDRSLATAWRFAGRPGAPPIHEVPIGSNIPVVPPSGYDRAAWRAERGYGPDTLLWAYFGFLNESKGGETLIRALAATGSPAHHLLMVGGRVGTSDPTNEAYAARVEDLMVELGVRDRVQWTGYVPTEQVSAALFGADVVVLPYRDGISFRRGSLHAAFAHGCPIISTIPRVPIPELRDGENVLLVPPDDPRTLAQAATRLWQERALRRQLARGALDLAELFTWDRIARRTVDEVFGPLVRP